MTEMEKREMKRQIKEATGELVQAVKLVAAMSEMEVAGSGELVIDVLVEQLEELRPKKTEAPQERFTDGSAPCAQTEQKKAMISQPMAGKSNQEIAAARDAAMKVLVRKGYAVVNTLFTDEWYSKEAMEERDVVQIPLCFLAKSLENMSKCHVAYFCKGWENARGCRIEHQAAKDYGLEIIYEDEYEREI